MVSDRGEGLGQGAERHPRFVPDRAVGMIPSLIRRFSRTTAAADFHAGHPYEAMDMLIVHKIMHRLT